MVVVKINGGLGGQLIQLIMVCALFSPFCGADPQSMADGLINGDWRVRAFIVPNLGNHCSAHSLLSYEQQKIVVFFLHKPVI